MSSGSKRTPLPRTKRVKTAFALCLCPTLISGCSQRYGFRVLNQSTNDLGLLTISWGGNEVGFPAVARANASYGDCYGCPGSDVAMYPRVRMPTKDLVISWLTPGPVRAVTNRVRVELSKDVLEAVRRSHSNFLLVVNADGTISLGVSAEPRWDSFH